MVSRAAFYRYYQDKYDLVEKIFEEIVTTVVREIDPIRRDLIHSYHSQSTPDAWVELFGQVVESQPTPPEPWVKFFEHFAHYERLYRALIETSPSNWEEFFNGSTSTHEGWRRPLAGSFLDRLVLAQWELTNSSCSSTAPTGRARRPAGRYAWLPRSGSACTFERLRVIPFRHDALLSSRQP